MIAKLNNAGCLRCIMLQVLMTENNICVLLSITKPLGFHKQSNNEISETSQPI